MEKMERRTFIQLSLLTGVGLILPGQVIGKSLDATISAPFFAKTDMICERVVGEQLLLSRKESQLYLNDVGTFLWSRINGTRSTYHLAELLANRYNIPFSQALDDCERFLTGMELKNFVTLCGRCPCYRFPV